MSDHLSLKETIERPSAAVYYALTNATALTEWLCDDARLEAQPNGRLYLYWRQGYYTVGEFTTLEPNQTVAYSWRGRGETAVSQVTFRLQEQDGRTLVSLVHSGLGEGPEWEQSRRELQTGWQTGLANLKSVLETGLDKRLYDRPFMGILPSEVVTAEQAAAEGLSVRGGVRISGTVPGSGADLAGLKAGDVVVQINDTEVVNFPTMSNATVGLKSGDVIQMTVCRQKAQMTFAVRMSRRPAPRFPETGQELAYVVADIYQALADELDALLGSVSEAEASHRPAGAPWSAKEILAHVIGTERVSQLNIALQMSGLPFPGWPENSTGWVNSMTAVYETVPDMIGLWKRTNAETLAMIQSFPPSLEARKGSYTLIANTLLNDLPDHTREHWQQIRELLAQK